jgi:putative N6-adenine-specific DNA methylase
MAPYRSVQDVYDVARAVPWSNWFTVHRSIRVDVTAIRSPLKSLDFATLRIKDAVCDRFRDETGRRPDVDTRAPDVRISAFLTDRAMTLYLDTSGEPLFKRGYRTETGEAPLRENLAAGIVLLTGWQPGEAFLDPMCGSGTLLLEAAHLGLDIAPGAQRGFGFDRLGDFDARLWKRLRDEARAREQRSRRLTIVGSDRSAEALRATRKTIERLHLSACVSLRRCDALDVEPPAAPGVLATNPPYGVRLGDQRVLAAFYPKFGDLLKQRFAGWRCYVFTAERDLPGLVRLRESKRTPLYNGAIECRLFEFRMVSGRLKERAATT